MGAWRWLLQAALLGRLAAATQLLRHAQEAQDTTTLRPREQSALAASLSMPRFTPKQYLISSSMSDRKIAWCELKNFKWTKGRSFTLVDAGLVEPAGLAFDSTNGYLYIADPGAASVYAYKLAVVNRQLTTIGPRTTILTNRTVYWISVDPSDNGVLFSDRDSGTINKLSGVNEIVSGAILAEQLPVVSIGDAFAQMTPWKPRILEIYSSNSSEHIVAPSAVLSDGMSLFWLNSAPTNASGELVRALGVPEANASLAQTAPVARSTGTVPSALASSGTHLFWSSEEPWGASTIHATRKTGSGYVHKMLKLGRARGLVWDGSNTLFVADEAHGNVYSLPVGRVQLNPPVTKAMALPGAYGVALALEKDIHLRG